MGEIYTKVMQEISPFHKVWNEIVYMYKAVNFVNLVIAHFTFTLKMIDIDRASVMESPF